MHREVKRQCSFELSSLDGVIVKGRYSIDSLKHKAFLVIVEVKVSMLEREGSLKEFNVDHAQAGFQKVNLKEWRIKDEGGSGLVSARSPSVRRQSRFY